MHPRDRRRGYGNYDAAGLFLWRTRSSRTRHFLRPFIAASSHGDGPAAQPRAQDCAAYCPKNICFIRDLRENATTDCTDTLIKEGHKELWRLFSLAVQSVVTD